MDKQTVAKFIGHQYLHNTGSPVRRAVVYDKNMETLVEGEYRTDDFLDILLLIVGRYDDNTVAFVHLSTL